MMTELAGRWCDGHGPGAWWPIFPVTFWVLVLLAAWWWVRRSRDHRVSAASVLADRYARGEISEEEYRTRLGVLKGRGPQAPGR